MPYALCLMPYALCLMPHKSEARCCRTHADVCSRIGMLTYAGEKVYASEVEGALLSHARVAQAAVVGVPDARLGVSVFVLLY